jgi:CheY-like chemotaxis protein
MAKILVIDDEQDVRMLIHECLTCLGHVVSEACNGKEGELAIEDDQPDLVICDLVMPGQEGIETIVSLGQTHPDLPVLAISGKDPVFLRMAQRLGAAGGLPKPFRLRELQAAVERLLPVS